jgi:hypothetical protein
LGFWEKKNLKIDEVDLDFCWKDFRSGKGWKKEIKSEDIK